MAHTTVTFDPNDLSKISIEGHGFSCSTGKECIENSKLIEAVLGVGETEEVKMKHAATGVAEGEVQRATS